nr:TPA: hypothetical protein BN1204_029765 [Neospora caninum Liverpool]
MIVQTELILPDEEQKVINAQVERWTKLVISISHTDRLFFKFASYFSKGSLKVRLYCIAFYDNEDPNYVSLLSGHRTKLMRPEVQPAYPKTRIRCIFDQQLILPFDASSKGFHLGIVAVMGQKKKTGEGEFRRKLIGMTELIDARRDKIRLRRTVAWALFVPQDLVGHVATPQITGELFFSAEGFEGDDGPALPKEDVLRASFDFGAEDRKQAKMLAKAERVRRGVAKPAPEKPMGFFQRLFGGQRQKDAQPQTPEPVAYSAFLKTSLGKIPLPPAHKPEFLNVLSDAPRPDDATEGEPEVLRIVRNRMEVQSIIVTKTAGRRAEGGDAEKSKAGDGGGARSSTRSAGAHGSSHSDKPRRVHTSSASRSTATSERTDRSHRSEVQAKDAHLRVDRSARGDSRASPRKSPSASERDAKAGAKDTQKTASGGKMPPSPRGRTKDSGQPIPPSRSRVDATPRSTAETRAQQGKAGPGADTKATAPDSKQGTGKASAPPGKQSSAQRSASPAGQQATQSAVLPAKKADPKAAASPAKKADPKAAASPAKKADPKAAASPAKKADPKAAASPAKKADPKAAASPAKNADPKAAASPAKKADPKAAASPAKKASQNAPASEKAASKQRTASPAGKPANPTAAPGGKQAVTKSAALGKVSETKVTGPPPVKKVTGASPQQKAAGGTAKGPAKATKTSAGKDAGPPQKDATGAKPAEQGKTAKPGKPAETKAPAKKEAAAAPTVKKAAPAAPPKKA